MSSKDADFITSAKEVMYSVSRHLILTVAGVYLLLLFATAVWPQQLAVNVWLMLPIVALACGGALLLLSRHFLAAQIIWLAGVYAVIVLATYLFQEPGVALLSIFLPLIAAIVIGWWFGLVMEVLLVALAWWLGQGLIFAGAPPVYGQAIIAGGALGLLIGWAATRALFSALLWFFFHYREAEASVSQIREQQLELKQTQESLLLANRELARLTDRLKALNLIADESRRIKEEFVANVSHELRTPLNMIIGFSEMIVRAPQVYGDYLPPALLSDINTIYLNSRHLLRLVDDVLDLSQVESGRMALDKRTCSLEEIVNAATQAVQPLYRSKDLYLEVSLPADLPPVLCDATRIRQVILNLLSNAGRFADHGGVRVSARREDGQVIISVSDTGPGISEEDQLKLFEPFRQLDGSMHRKQDGFGLGLSISKKFVELHDGKMWLESKVGQGTTFLFSLPCETPPLADAAAGDRAVRWFSPHSEYEYRQLMWSSRAPAPAINPRFVLLDDRNILSRLFARYLDDVDLVSVSNAQDALRELSRLPAQALIINSSIHGEAPISRERLARLPFDTPTLTCRVPSGEVAAERLHAVRYLIKPVAYEALVSTLESLGENVQSVLLVDDDPEALRLLARVLTSTGRNYRILRARDGVRALSLLRQHRPDAIFLDLMMPEMDGFRVLEEKERDPAIRDIPAVVISARDPMGAPIVSSELTVTCGEGLSVSQLLACIQAISGALSPSAQRGDGGLPKSRPA